MLLATRLVPGRLRGAGLGLLAVAISEAALQRLPASISAPGVYRAFDDGWGFGLLIAAYGAVVTLAASRSLRSRQRP
ncbi:MAG: hypothetical protein DLM65_00265 [Candidatus Aeolococcus gillhamiae]|uniref:Uncharacterized protein n=1 Tax=Candidatus Aeolococcus gillhamiae TaxID=3127015 RepID=A0A2W5ZFD8_9BACT|nr:MAG: hypothetical protein DLM65_00265 [Candidatus Dormibacter sp. RRmetagenome_bin12]